jgi:multidrug transporter EmrE-like cation transporter
MEVPPPEVVEAVAETARVSRASSFISLALVLVSVGLATAGHLTLKAAMNDVGRIGTAEVRSAGDTIARAAKEPKLWAGLSLFGLSAVFWLVVLSRVSLSIAYPFAGLSYVVIVALDRFVLEQPVPSMRWVGVAAIAIGIALVGFSTRSA